MIPTPMVYFLNFSYDEKRDEYFAYVDDGTRAGKSIYQIDTVEEVCDYIKTGRMNHIDDVVGLAKFLKAQGFMNDEDKLVLAEETLW